jgi:3-oxoadipate enol-lactonase
LVTPDLPGHGSAAGPFTLEGAVAAARASFDDADEVHLVGISGGAAVGLLTALGEPGRVTSLVLSGGFAHAPRLLAAQRALMTVIPWRALRAASRSFSSGGRPEYAQVASEDLQRCGKSTLLHALREIAQLDIRDRLTDIAVPALVLCGARDRPNIAASRELAAGIPGAELRIVPGANHFWNLQQPELVNQTVSQFVEATSPTQPQRP